jgi:hypothetical protein
VKKQATAEKVSALAGVQTLHWLSTAACVSAARTWGTWKLRMDGNWARAISPDASRAEARGNSMFD